MIKGKYHFSYVLILLVLGLSFGLLGSFSAQPRPVEEKVYADSYGTVDLDTLYSIKDNPSALAEVSYVKIMTEYYYNAADSAEQAKIAGGLEIVKNCPNVSSLNLKIRGCSLDKNLLNYITTTSSYLSIDIYCATIDLSGVSNSYVTNLFLFATDVINFSSITSAFPNLTSLSYWWGSGYVPVDFSRLTKLNSLSLHQYIPDYNYLCQKITHVSSLDLDESNLKNSDTQYLARLTNLRTLSFESTVVDDISFLRNLPNLNNLSLPSGVRNLDVLYEIDSLYSLNVQGYTATFVDYDLIYNLAYLRKAPPYYDSQSESLKALADCSVRIKNIINSFNFTSSTTDVEKIEQITYYVCSHLEYVDDPSFKVADITVPLYKGQGVCSHFAIFMQTLLSAAGIEAYYIQGYPKSPNGEYTYDRHAWNVVRVNGIWYGIDATWINTESQLTLEEYKNLGKWKYYFMRKTTTNSTALPEETWDLQNVDDVFALSHFSASDPSIDSTVAQRATVSSISVTSNPLKTEYLRGQEYLDLLGGKLKVTYSDGLQTTINLSNYMVKVTGFSNSTVGTKNLSVSYGGKTTSFSVNIVSELSKTLSRIEVESPPRDTFYAVGEKFNLSGGKLRLVYSNGTSDIIPMLYATSNVTTLTRSGNIDITLSFNSKQTTFKVLVLDSSFDGLIILKKPNKLVYTVGEEVNLDGIRIIYVYNSGGNNLDYFDVDNLYLFTISPQTLSNEGTQTITLTYYTGKTTTFNVTVNAQPKTLTSIAVANPPTKTTYTQGETLSLTGGTIRLNYSDGSTNTISMSYATASPTQLNTVGQQTITLTYNGKTTTFNVTVNAQPKTLTSIAVANAPTKTTYTQGETLSLAGGTIRLNYSDGSTNTIAMSYATASPTQLNTVGQQTITLTYNGKTTTFNVTVNAQPKTLTSIAVANAPTKTTYTQGETLSLSGGTIRLNYSDGSTNTISMSYATASPTQLNTVGTQTITLTYNGKTTTFNVTVNAQPKTLTSIAVAKVPTKTNYTQGETIDLTGGIIRLNYSDSSTNTIVMSNATASPTQLNTVGTQTITLSYNGKTTTFNVTVNAQPKTLTSIAVAKVPTKTSYTQGETIDLTGGTIRLNYSDGSSNTISMSNVTASPTQLNTVGTQTITLTYNGKTTTFNVTVNAPTLSRIEVESPTKLNYTKGDSLNLSGGKIKRIYSNGSSDTVISLSNSAVTVTPMTLTTDSTSVRITVKYQGFEAYFNVTVRIPDHLAITQYPKQVYTQNDYLDLSAGKFKVVYSDETSSTNEVGITNDMITSLTINGVAASGLELDRVGTYVATITYQNMVKSFNIIVRAAQKTLSKIEVDKLPNKTQYIKGESLDLTGGTIKRTFSDGSYDTNISMSEAVATPTVLNTVGDSVRITLTYSYNGQKCITSFNVTVEAIVVTEIKLINSPKTTYYIGDEFSWTGGKLQLKYNNNTTGELTLPNGNVTCENFDSSTAGTKTVTIKYLTYTTQLSVTIIADSVKSIAVTKSPTKMTYYVGQGFNTTGGEITVTYNSGKAEVVVMATAYGVTVPNPIFTQAGTQSVTVSYLNKATTQINNIQVLEDAISKISIKTYPLKTKYIVNEELDLSDGELSIIYLSGKIETVSMAATNVEITGYDKTKVATQKLTIKYGGKTIELYVQVSDKSVKSISIKDYPKTVYYVGQDLDLTGGTISVTYDNTSVVDTFSMTQSGVSVTGFDNSTAQSCKLTVSYKGKETDYLITVNNKIVASIVIKETPNKLNYILGESLELDGGEITVVYQDKTTDTISMKSKDVTVSGWENEIGYQTIKVTYLSKSTSFIINVKNEVKSVGIKFYPRLVYVKGENLDLTDAALSVVYEDGSAGAVAMTSSDVVISGFDSNNVATQKITVSYKGFSTSFHVKVREAQIVSIKINKNPSKISYIVGEPLDLSGGMITAVLENGEEVPISMRSNDVGVVGFSQTVAGSYSLTISYHGKTTSFDVTVADATVTNISIKSKPNKLVYVKGEKLELDGGFIEITYNNGTIASLPMTAASIGILDYDLNSTGDKDIWISYGKFNTSFTVNVKNKIRSISIKTQPSKINYNKGEGIELVGGVLSVVYEDGSVSEVPMTSDMVQISGYDSDATGEQTIQVIYNSFATEYKVSVGEENEAKVEKGLGIFVSTLIIVVGTFALCAVVMSISARNRKKRVKLEDGDNK